MKGKQKNVREVVVELLETIEKNQSYSNLLLNSTIKNNQVNSKDIGLLTEITYGTLQRKMTLDFFLEPFLKNPKKMDSWVLQLLRMTLYQMVFLDKIPDRAAIFEAVDIAKKRGHKGIASLVNGVLRNIQRQGVRPLEEIEDPVLRLSIETSHPYWLVQRWVKQLGLDRAKEMCEVNLTAPLQTARVNLLRNSKEEAIEKLSAEGFQVEASPIIPEAIKSYKGNLANSVAFKEGFITIQDESSMLVAHAMGVNPDETVLDACSAPGGKSTHIAEKMHNTGQIYSLDLHEHKVKLVASSAHRLGLTNINPRAMDSRKAPEHFSKETFDRVLLDAPCSGLGVMRRKPDMKYTKTEADLYQLKNIQLSLLKSVAPLLKKGGALVYSTCTVDEEENNLVVRQFLDEHGDFEIDLSLKDRMPEAVKPLVNGYELQILPQDFGSDGFYIASLRKKVE